MLDAEWIEVKAKVIADLKLKVQLNLEKSDTTKKLNPWLLLNQKTLQKY
jgi:hypothetical protein